MIGVHLPTATHPHLRGARDRNGGDSTCEKLLSWYYKVMENYNEVPETQAEAPQDLVEIRHEDAITVNDALTVASQVSFVIGRSTLQRWAKAWHTLGNASPVKCILVTTRMGSVYKIDKKDFEAWALEQKENDRSLEIPQGLVGSSETSSDLERPNETFQDPLRPQSVSQDIAMHRGAPRSAERPRRQADTRVEEYETLRARLKELEDENLQLKIDVGVRKELIIQAKQEVEKTRDVANSLLRENGALEFQIRQLDGPKPRTIEATPNFDRGGEPPSYQFSGDDNQPGDAYSMR